MVAFAELFAFATLAASGLAIPATQANQAVSAANASTPIDCKISKAGVLGMWQSDSPLLNQVAYNLSLSGLPDWRGHTTLVTMNHTEKARSERFSFYQCTSNALPQPIDLYYQFGQIRPESRPDICLTIADGVYPQDGRFTAQQCRTTDTVQSLAPQWFEYDFYANLGFFQGSSNETMRTKYTYNQNTGTPNKMLRVTYRGAGYSPQDARTALRISIQATNPQIRDLHDE